MVEKVENKNIPKKPEVVAKPEQKRWKKFLPIMAGIVVMGAVAATTIITNTMNQSRKPAAEYVTKEQQDSNFDILARGIIKTAKKIEEKKGYPVIKMSSYEEIYPPENECDPCKEQTKKDTASLTEKIKINAEGKKGDTTFIAKMKKNGSSELEELGCRLKEKIIECDSLASIEKVCEGEKPTCKGGALANLTGELKEKIKNVGYKFYSSLLGNGSCDKGYVILKDGEEKAVVVIGYNENEIPEAKNSDCKVVIREEKTYDTTGEVGTRE